MSSIPVAILRFSDNNFKRFYLIKKNTFCQFLNAFPKCSQNLEHSEQKEEYPSQITNEILGSERDVYLSV